MAAPLAAATINVTGASVSTGMNYTIGVASATSSDSVVTMGTGITTVQSSVDDFIKNEKNNQIGTAGVTGMSEMSVGIENDVNGNAILSGSWFADLNVNRLSGLGQGAIFSGTDVNRLFFSFDVIDGPVDFELGIMANIFGGATLRPAGGGIVGIFGVVGNQTRTGTLSEGSYTLSASFSDTANGSVNNQANVNVFGQGNISLSFADSSVSVASVAAVPLPAGAWLMIAGLFGLDVIRRWQS